MQLVLMMAFTIGFVYGFMNEDGKPPKKSRTREFTEDDALDEIHYTHTHGKDLGVW